MFDEVYHSKESGSKILTYEKCGNHHHRRRRGRREHCVHLTEKGAKDVLILEREAAQGFGSTGKATGGVRAQFETEINIKMSLYSLNFSRIGNSTANMNRAAIYFCNERKRSQTTYTKCRKTKIARRKKCRNR